MTRADWNANVSAAWCILALIAATVLAWKAWAFVKREGRPISALRVQLAAALALVLYGDAFTRAVAWLFWELRARDHGVAWPQSWVMLAQVGGIFAIIGASLSIRALTYDDWGNRIWLAALACAAIGVIAF